MHVYILYSQKLDRFYIGQTALNPEQRLEEHNSARNENSFTTRGIPWTLFLTLACDSRNYAREAERHIKHMKSKAFLAKFHSATFIACPMGFRI
jgi:putative endonuclease